MSNLRPVRGSTSEPAFDGALGPDHLGGIDEVLQAKDAAGWEHVGDPLQGQRLPEVGGMVYTVAFCG